MFKSMRCHLLLFVASTEFNRRRERTIIVKVVGSTFGSEPIEADSRVFLFLFLQCKIV